MVYQLNKIVNIQKFENEIRANIATVLHNVTIFGDYSMADFTEELSSEEYDTFQNLANNHEPISLQEVKDDKLSQLDVDTRNYIVSKYSLERQSSLALIRGDARADGLTNRFTYVQQVVNWTNSVLMYHYGLVDYINSRTSIEEVQSISWDFNANTAADPEVSIRTALTIQD